MRRIQHYSQIIAITLVICGLQVAYWHGTARVAAASAPSLTISQLKITSSNGQFITLYNATDAALDASKFQLEYFNSYDISKATSSKLIGLSGTVPPHSYLMVNDGTLQLCYQMLINSVSLGLSSTAGMIEVLAFDQSSPGSGATPQLLDYAAWSKTAVSDAQTLPANTSGFLLRQPTNQQNNPIITTAGSGSWQPVLPDPNNACKLQKLVNGVAAAPIASGPSQLLPSIEPAALVEAAADNGNRAEPTPSLPPGDLGLTAPTLTELLPNPAGVGTDATDEFIELYNPNPVRFDLTGFGLQVGVTTLHHYTFPGGSTLAPSSFTALYAGDTGLSLSNTSGAAALTDPFGNVISSSDAYGTAKDGQAWALAKGKWQWTTKLTPNAANVIVVPAAAKKKAAAATTKTTGGSVKGAKTAQSAASPVGNSSNTEATATPIHFWALAAVGGCAVLYGAYEYRADMANRIYQLRRYFSTRFGPGR